MTIKTKEDLTGFIDDRFKEWFGGATKEEVKKVWDEFQSKDWGEIKEAALQRRIEEVEENHNPIAWDPQDRSHPYVQKAGHLIRTDFITRKAHGKINRYESQGAGMRFARYIRAVGAAKQANESVETVLKAWGDDWMIKELHIAAEREKGTGDGAFDVKRALGFGSFTGGGAMVPLDYSNEMIELLRAKNVIRAAGATVMPMPKANMTIPRQTGSATASYGRESANHTATDQSTDQVRLNARKMRAMTAISNDLMRIADPSADVFVRNDLLKVAANREDLAFVRGDGTNDQPRGLRYAMATANVSAINTGGASPQNEIDDLTDLLEDLAGSNVDMDRPAWFMNSRTMHHFMFLRDTGNGFFFKDEMSSGTLIGIPFYMSNQIPRNLGGGTNEAELYYAEMSDVVIGDHLAPVIEVFPGGAYWDGTAVQSGISRDETVVRLIQEHDIVLRHAESAAVKTAVTY